jgi:hypothetical protein
VVKCLETLLLAYWTHVSYVKAGLPSVQMKVTNVAFLLMVNGWTQFIILMSPYGVDASSLEITNVASSHLIVNN